MQMRGEVVGCSAAANNAVTTGLIEFTPLTAESHVTCCMLHGGAPSTAASQIQLAPVFCSLALLDGARSRFRWGRLELQLLQHCRTTDSLA